MQVDLEGKVALVTGGGSGIGRATVIALAGCGATVVVGFRKNEAGARGTVGECRAAGGSAREICADIADPDAVKRMVDDVCEREHGLDILVNNAGDPVAARPIGEWTPGLLDRVLAINLRGVILCSQAAMGPMRKQGGGRIINISSIGAVEGGSPRTLPYAAAKGGVETFTRGLARVLGPDGITVNSVSPGSIRTSMQEEFATPDYIAHTTGESALGRGGEPEEVASAVLFLASDQGAFITGQVIRVDGGRRL